MTESSKLASLPSLAFLTAGSVLPVSPNNLSKMALGLFSIGNGVVSFAQVIVFVYAQLKPSSQEPAKSLPSIASSKVAN